MKMYELLQMDMDNFPENMLLYKDSGLWQVRSDDMKRVLYQQKVDEGFFGFIERVTEAEE